MKSIKLLFILMLMLFFCSVFAQEQDSTDVMTDNQVESFGFSENYTLGQVSELVNLSVDSLRVHFKLNAKDMKLASRKLKALRLDPEDIIIYKDDLLYRFNHNFTLKETAKFQNMPIKKMMEYLELPVQDKSYYDKTLYELDIKPEKIVSIKQLFDANKSEFGAILTMIGMMVVFVALAVTALIITQLIHLNERKSKSHGHSSHQDHKSATINTPAGKISAPRPEDLSSAAIVAVITAIHLRMQELDEESKIMLTWRRANVSMWQATGKVQFPNSQFFHNKKS